ncbi:hypothetical protein CI109_101846 [Kwoniella shandongensis]|uniref:Uncharacterized protein n=1 Tax=Kwoniella shandongensis TaxID=1734106 RepID=A0A5M6BPG1_9TREE|nr:uncharacterized protein CI109_007023 [Kwoniella shandongensis]KAA5524637.1 hypothetical protein CI109_007023 [Kwoniella shandongensis]
MAPLTVFVTTWNTGLQGSKAQSQDLTGWLLPVLHNTAKDPELPEGIVPDLYAIGVQELLPVHLALAGLSRPVLAALTNRIQSLLSAHATSLSPNKTPEKYSLVQRTSHVGVALWVFARDKTMEGRLGKSGTATLGLWYGGMGNKAAVGVRVPVRRGKDGGWEIFTFVNTHLEAHDKNVPRRNAQYRDILSSLVFNTTDPLASPTQIFETSHLVFLGDLNYRLAKTPPAAGLRDGKESDDVLILEKARAEMVDNDTLRREQREGRVFGGLREGDLTRFAPTYKRIVGQVEGYSKKRIPGWTDRILFASHTDPPHLFSPQSTLDPIPAQAPHSTTAIVHFSSTPELTISDHKPVHAVLSLPEVEHSAPAPHLAPLLPPAPSHHSPRPPATSREVLLVYKLLGTILDRIVGWPWCLVVLLGGGNERTGMGVGAFLAMIWGVYWTGVWSA